MESIYQLVLRSITWLLGPLQEQSDPWSKYKKYGPLRIIQAKTSGLWTGPVKIRTEKSGKENPDHGADQDKSGPRNPDLYREILEWDNRNGVELSKF